MKTKVAIFCSGSGSNAQKIIEYFKHHESIKIEVLMANKPDAYALERAKNLNIPTWVFTKEDYHAGRVLDELKKRNIDWIVLAGFLWLVPEHLILHYPDKIINIHPALLPKFGGKGMYGMNVHKTVVENNEKESGITIHFVNTKYDEGNIIFQTTCAITPQDSPEEVAKKVQVLEHEHFPKIIEKIIMEERKKEGKK